MYFRRKSVAGSSNKIIIAHDYNVAFGELGEDVGLLVAFQYGGAHDAVTELFWFWFW